MDFYNIDLDTPLRDLSDEELNVIKYGSYEEIPMVRISTSGNRYEGTRFVEGILPKIERKYMETVSEEYRTYYKKYLTDTLCPECKGQRLNKYALAVKLDKLNIFELSNKSIDELLQFIENLKLTEYEQEVCSLILSELKHRLEFLINVGLNYLTLNRKAETLSGGEAQRIRLATQIGSALTGVLYVMDEPSIGLHQKDNQRLINSLRKIVDIGNTLIVVEHDEETIREADYIVDIGPEAGEKGGKIVAYGSLEDICSAPESITGKYLSGV